MNATLKAAILKTSTNRPAQVKRIGSVDLGCANDAVSTLPAPSARGGIGAGGDTINNDVRFGLQDKPANFEEALQEMARRQLLTEDKLRRIRSDVRTVARCVWLSSPHTRSSKPLEPAGLPCNPVDLRLLLRHVMPGKFWEDKPGRSSDRDSGRPDRIDRVKHQWSTLRSSLSRVLYLTGWLEDSRSGRLELTPAWTGVADYHAYPTQRALARRFGRYCVKLNIAPENVDEVTIEDFRDYLNQHTIDLNVTGTINALRRIWNKSCTKPECGLSPLRTRRRPGSYVLPSAAFPNGFLLDLEQYLALLLKPNPFDGARLGRARKQVTVNSLREVIKRFVSVALTSGIDHTKVTTVSDLGKPFNVQAILMDQYFRLGEGQAWPAGAVTIASYLKMIIRHSATLSGDEKAASIVLCDKVRASKLGMTRKNRDRLAILGDPKLLDRLLGVPSDCYKIADARYRASQESVKQDNRGEQTKGKIRAANLFQRAVALDILLTKPLRRSMLVALNLEEHFVFDDKGNPRSFCIPGAETKNGQDSEADIPRGVADRLKTYITRYRPLLVKGETPYLFPGNNDGHLHAQTLANGIVSIVHDHAGLPFNTHLVRHLIATLILDDDPGNGPIAQRMLDHTDLKTTTRFYGIQRTKSAQAEYARILEARRSKSRVPTKPSRNKR